ncbi:MAG: cyanophycinase [Phycisphaeraceae bacterium]|nr:cyanophycinase [Phycisphaeraceae bacterium]
MIRHPMRLLAAFLFLALAASPAAVAQGFICADGGGLSTTDEASRRIVSWAVERSKRGHVVILGAIPLENDRRPEWFRILGAASVDTLVVDETNADDQATYDAILKASLVFIRGGDQSRYVKSWRHTKTAKAIKDVYAKGGVISGTSAGCAVLGEFVYDAIHGSLSPTEALTSARHPDLTLTRGFLDFAPGVLFDTHFGERGRLPRLASMLAAAAIDHNARIMGIGVDARTAVAVWPDGTAEVIGEGGATLLTLLPESKAEMPTQGPPRVQPLGYSQLSSGYRFNIRTGEVVQRPAWVTPITEDDQRRRTYPTFEPVVIKGSLGVGESKDRVTHLGDVCVVTRAWSAREVETAMKIGQLWVANDPGAHTIWIDGAARIEITQEYKMMVGCEEGDPISVVMLSGATMTHAGVSPTEQPSIENARLSLLPACMPPAGPQIQTKPEPEPGLQPE